MSLSLVRAAGRQIRSDMHFIKRLYDWILGWANSAYSVPALGLLALAEASFFPIPPDVLLIAMALSRPNRAYRYALVASVGSVFGGILGYSIGWGFWGLAQDYFYQYVPGVNAQNFDYIGQLFADYGFWTIFAAGFTPLPYKLFTIAAGVFNINLIVFVFASLISRSLRFFLVATLFFHYGQQARTYIEKYFNILSYGVLALIIVVIVVCKLLG